MSTGGEEGKSELGLDVSKYVKGMQDALEWTKKFEAGVKAVAITAINFNSVGEQTDAVAEIITKANEKIVVSLIKTADGYKQGAAVIRRSLEDIAKAERDAANEKKKEQAKLDLTAFRRGPGAALQKSVFPKGGEQGDYRQLFGDLQGLEGYIARASISFKRAKAIVDDIRAGTSTRITKSATEENFRLDALKLINDAESLGKRLAAARQKAVGAASSSRTTGALESTFGKLDPAATESQVKRIEASFIKIQQVVKDAGIEFPRFEDLVKKSMAGAADPVSVAEKRVVQSLKQIASDFAAAKARAASLAASTNVPTALKSSFGALDPAATDTQAKRVEASFTRIQSIVQDSGIAFSRFQDLVTKSIAGVADPVGVAERKIVQSLQRIQTDFANAKAKGTSNAAAAGVQAELQKAFGSIKTDDTSVLARRIETNFLQVQKIVGDTGISFSRFQDLVAKTMKGAADPVTATERQITNSLKQIKQDTDALNNRNRGEVNSYRVRPSLEKAFGALDPAATQAQAKRVESIFQQLEKTVKESGIEFTRLKDLVTKSMAGVADPVGVAERKVAAALKQLQADFAAAQATADKLKAKATSSTEATDVGSALKSKLNLGGLGNNDLERVYAQIAKIQALVAKGPTGGGISQKQFENIWAAVSTGAKTSFRGAEETARASLSKIKNIISGELSNPFEVNISFERSFNVLRTLFAANFAIELVEKFKAVVDEAAEFQRAIALIQTITQDANLSFNDWAGGIERVSNELGKPIIEVAAAGYDLLSNQVTRAADTFDVLSTAGQFARITNSNTEDSVNLLSTAINTFRLNTGDAGRIADEFFTVIDLGRVKAQGLANSGRTFEFGKTLGASIQDINASLVTLTQSGIKEDTALTLLNNVFQKMLNPTKELQALYDKLGVSTGENFVKTYGFAGALQKLKEATGGSSAKLAELFNEIRGYQGVSNLVDRIDILNQTYQEFEHSAERAAAAKEKFDNLPGQRYLEQTNKVKNLFLTGLKSEILEDVLFVSDAFGGLDKAIKGLIITTGVFATTLTTALAVEKIIEFNKALVLTRATGGGLLSMFAGGGWTIGLSLAAGAAAYLIFKLIQAREEADNLFQTVGEGIDEVNRKAQKKRSDELSKDVKETTDALEKKKRALLSYATIAKQGLTLQGEKLDTVGKDLGENLKDSLSLVLSSSKNALQEIVNKQTEAFRGIKQLQKEKAGIAGDRGSALFDFYKTKLGTADGQFGPNEKTLYQRRINQLQNQGLRAARSGDKEGALDAAKEIEKITSELASKTVNINGIDFLKYAGGENAINKALQLRGRLLDIVIAKREREARLLDDQRDKASARVKEQENAAKALYEIRLTDEKTGKPIDKNQEEFEARYRKAEARVRASLEGTRGAGALESEDLIERRKKKAFADSEKFFQNRRERQKITGREDQVSGLQDNINKEFGEEAQKKLKAIQVSAEESGKAFDQAKKEVQQYLAQFKVNGPQPGLRTGGVNDLLAGKTFVKGPLDSTDKVVAARKQRLNILAGIQRGVDENDFAKVKAGAEDLRALYERLGISKRKAILGPDKQILGAGDALTIIRAKANAAALAQRTANADRAAFNAAKEAPNKAAAAVQAIINKYGELEGANNKVAEAIKGSTGETAEFIASLTKATAEAVKEMGSLAENIRRARAAVTDPIGSTYTGVDSNNSGLPKASPFVRPPGKSMGGEIGYYAKGGAISDFLSGKYARGTDNVPIMAGRNEFVMNAGATARFKSQLIAMNSGFDTGGQRAHQSTTTVGDIHLNITGGDTSQQTIKSIGRGLQRELRRGTISFRR